MAKQKRTVTLGELLAGRQKDPYTEQYGYITQLLENGLIEPVKSSPGNGKNPPLYTRYRYVVPKKDYSEQNEELLYRTNMQINTDYYLRHPEKYEEERRYVRRLSDFLDHSSDSLLVPISENERSFSIWGEEKFLGKGGERVLRNCGILPSALNCYHTAEPFPYFTASRSTPQNVLVIENNDPFYGIRSHLLAGHTKVLGAKFGTIIYGGGKRAWSSFGKFRLSAEPYMTAPENRFFYYGDIDYEGIYIYEYLADIFSGISELVPFVTAYEKMLEKAEERGPDFLPMTKEGQKDRDGNRFFSYFNERTAGRIKELLRERRYIPQEILTTNDY